MAWCDTCSEWRGGDVGECVHCGDDPDNMADDVDAEAKCENCGWAGDGTEAGHSTPGGWWCRRCVAEEEG